MKSTKTYAAKKLEKFDLNEILHQNVQNIINLLKKELPKVKAINALVLFGSFARGDYSPRHSDIDVMVFLDTARKDPVLEEQIRKKVIQLSLGRSVNIHVVFQYQSVEQEDKSLMLTIAKEGEVLFARKTMVLSRNLLGLTPYYLIKFDTAKCQPVVKNKLQRFLHGYTINGKHYAGIIDGEKVMGAGKGAVLVPEEMRQKVLLLANEIGVKTSQLVRLYKAQSVL
jgi:predicted nucleotidyltransferase